MATKQAPPTLEEIIERAGIEEDRLEERCSCDALKKIAKLLYSWQTVASELGLDEKDIESIVSENTKSPMQRQEALLKWSEKFGFKATYGVLLQALLDDGRADTAETVCRIWKDQGNDVPSSTPKKRSKPTCSVCKLPGHTKRSKECPAICPHCGKQAKLYHVKDPKKETYGRPFYRCHGQCDYFQWADEKGIDGKAGDYKNPFAGSQAKRPSLGAEGVNVNVYNINSSYT